MNPDTPKSSEQSPHAATKNRFRRYDLKKLLADPELRRKLIVQSTIATQAREGIDVSEAQAEDSYYVVTQAERAAFFGLVPFRTEPGENDGRHVEFTKAIGYQGSKATIAVALKDFASIEDSPIVYDKVGLLGPLFRGFPKLSPTYCETKQGLIATSSERFVRYHWEVASNSVRRWVPYAKGGEFCRFYSDLTLVFDWTNDGQEIKELSKSLYGSASRTIKCEEYYFREGITWAERSKGLNARILPQGAIFNAKGPSAFLKDKQDTDYILGILNSSLSQAFVNCFGTTSWGCQYVARIPTPPPGTERALLIAKNARLAHDIKKQWDNGNELSTVFSKPWILSAPEKNNTTSISIALDTVLQFEIAQDAVLSALYNELDEAVYLSHNINHKLRGKIEQTINGWKTNVYSEEHNTNIQVSERPAEVVWPQMERHDRDQKRREHVDRLLTYLVKQILVEDEDHLVCLQRVAHETPLLDRLREKLAACFPAQDPSSLETAVVNELKKKTKGYHRAESLAEWLHDVFFETHNALYQQRPLLWHLASSQTRTEPGFACIVHAHHFDADALAKLRSVYIRDRIAVLKREAAQAGNDGKADQRLDLLALAEEVEAYDAKLALLQEGAHTGPANGERDYRILTPWKSAEDRPQGWHPDVDDGIKVNLAPLARTNLLRRRLKLGTVESDE